MRARLLSISGSPIEGGSTELLLGAIVSAFEEDLTGFARVESRFVRLNDISGIPCQSCGEAPSGGYCLYDDDLTRVYDDVANCDCLLFGSPVYFDSVSAQAKLFIDRCNCFRPADFRNVSPGHDFIKLLGRKRPGGMVLIGGDDGWFEGARRCIAGFFKWIEVTNEGLVTFRSNDFREKGLAADSAETLDDAAKLGRSLAKKVRENHGR